MNKYTKKIIDMGRSTLTKRKEMYYCIGETDTIVITKTQHATDPLMYSIDSYPSRSEYSKSSSFEQIEEKEFESVFRKAKSTLNKITSNG